MYNIHWKSNLARHLNSMRKAFPKDYNFFPQTWVLPIDANSLRLHLRLACSPASPKRPCYIVKPQIGSQGRGIYLVSDPNKLPMKTKCIVQEYLAE